MSCWWALLLLSLSQTLASTVRTAASTADVVANMSRSNIVFLLADEVGWNSVGWHSNLTLSPHLDALAAGGVKLERHYVQRWCAPTRATLLSGRYAFNTGFNEYMPVEQRAALPFAYTALPQLLKDAGWRTHMLGKVRVHGPNLCAALLRLSAHSPARLRPTAAVGERADC
jgi:arylsulfatase A-like enzyme